MNTAAAVEWLKAVSTSFVGAKYEPAVEWLSLALVVVLFFTLLVRLLSRPPMIALAQQAWSLLKEADSAFKYKTEYAPEMERIRRRVAPYGDLVMHAILAAVATLCLIAVFFVALIFAARPSALGTRLYLSSRSLAWYFRGGGVTSLLHLGPGTLLKRAKNAHPARRGFATLSSSG
jgi:hypothetical protein